MQSRRRPGASRQTSRSEYEVGSEPHTHDCSDGGGGDEAAPHSESHQATPGRGTSHGCSQPPGMYGASAAFAIAGFTYSGEGQLHDKEDTPGGLPL
eukprot:7379497-Prymnesium_polylepis.3